MHRWLNALLILPAVSCSSPAPTSSSSSADTGSAADDTAAAEDVVAEVEATPCGTNVGDILCDVPLEGYVRDVETTGLSTAAPYASAKLSEILAQGKQKYAFVWTSAYW